MQRVKQHMQNMHNIVLFSRDSTQLYCSAETELTAQTAKTARTEPTAFCLLPRQPSNLRFTSPSHRLVLHVCRLHTVRNCLLKLPQAQYQSPPRHSTSRGAWHFLCSPLQKPRRNQLRFPQARQIQSFSMPRWAGMVAPDDVAYC